MSSHIWGQLYNYPLLSSICSANSTFPLAVHDDSTNLSPKHLHTQAVHASVSCQYIAAAWAEVRSRSVCNDNALSEKDGMMVDAQSLAKFWCKFLASAQSFAFLQLMLSQTRNNRDQQGFGRTTAAVMRFCIPEAIGESKAGFRKVLWLPSWNDEMTEKSSEQGESNEE